MTKKNAELLGRFENSSCSRDQWEEGVADPFGREIDRITSTAIDVYIGCTSKEQETFVRQKLHKMSLIDTNGLPYQTVYVKNIYYMITTNIDVTDGLANGAVGKIVHAQTNYEGLVKTIGLKFPDLPQIGKKLRRKAAGYAAEINTRRMAVPIVLRSSNIPLNNNKTIFVKRTHVPLVCACATTIHKSQGNTYSEIVYEYDRRYQSLFYVALSRVTSIEGIYMWHAAKSNAVSARRRIEWKLELKLSN
ncbi:ATP-dependent DNA helicase [Trichonephila clavipes]|nr:ATP-dependent DNA helicase [Trichonephila clavipes]